MNPFRRPEAEIRKTRALLVCAGLLALAACAPHTPAPVETRETKLVKPIRKPVQANGLYRVRKGDTLYGIAWRYGKDFEKVAAWNGIREPFRIYPGQRLRLTPPPAVAKSKPPRRKAVPPAKPRPPVTAPLPPQKTTPVAPAPAPAAVPPPANAASGNPPDSGAGEPSWRWPTRGALVQTFRQGDKTRQGIRIAGRSGQPIVAAEAGKVVYSGSGLPGYGKLIIIKHNKNYLSAYGFNRKILVQDGDSVNRGEQVAEMGQSAGGKPLLHFEIRRSDRVLDPLRVLPKR